MDNNLDEKKLTPEQRAAKAPDAAVQKKTIKDRLISAFRTGMPKNKKVVAETIRKVDGGYRLVAGSGRNLGTYPTKAGAEKREKQVNYFKHVSEGVSRISQLAQQSREKYNIGKRNNNSTLHNATVTRDSNGTMRLNSPGHALHGREVNHATHSMSGHYTVRDGNTTHRIHVPNPKNVGENSERQVVPPPEAMPSDTRVIKTRKNTEKRTTGSFNKFGNFTPGMKEEKATTKVANTLKGTPVVSLKDLTDKETKRRSKPLKADDPRVKFHKEEAEQIDESTVTTRDGDKVKAGDAIGYKDGYEKYGQVHKVEGDYVHVRSYDPDTGEHYTHRKHKSEIWKEMNEEAKQIDEINKDTVTKYKTKATNVKRALPSLKREFQRKIEKAEALAAQHSPGGKLPRGVGRNPAIAAKAREEAAKAKKSLAVFDRWETNRTKGLERAEKRLAKEEVEQIDELSKQRASELSARAKKHQNMGDEAKNKGDFETANRHYNHADKIYSHMINRSMVATRKNLADMKRMRGELGEGIGAVNRAFGFTPYSVLNPPPKRKPGLLKKIKNKIKDKLKIDEAARKPEHTHAVVRQGNILSYHTSLKSAHKRADNLDQKYGATVHTVKPL